MSFDHLLVNNIFYTVQGEGKNIGKPSIFLRLAGCNLRCVWCDTKYTWLYSEKTLISLKQIIPNELKQSLGNKFYDKTEEIQEISPNKIIEIVSQYPCKHIVITGGEPLLQIKKLIPLCFNLIKLGYSIEIETNGTISPSGLHSEIQFNVSPKLSNSYNDETRTILPDVLAEFNRTNSYFKFVISKKTDLQEVNVIVKKVKLNHEKIFLMPQAQNAAELAERSDLVLKLSKSNGYNFSYRLHIQLYGDKRGV